MSGEREIGPFADGRGVADYAPAVLAMTRRLYPSRAIRSRVERDPEGQEEHEDYYILFDVDVTGLPAEQLTETQRQWCQEIFRHCPAPLVGAFRLGWAVD